MSSGRAREENDAGRPNDRQIAGAYLRIAHIYRAGEIRHLATEYYGLVITRFATCPDLAARARIWLARCLAATARIGPARRHLRAVVRDHDAPGPLRCHAGLRLLQLAVRSGDDRARRETRRLLVRRLRDRIHAHRLARWVRIADRIEAGAVSRSGMVAES